MSKQCNLRSYLVTIIIIISLFDVDKTVKTAVNKKNALRTYQSL